MTQRNADKMRTMSSRAGAVMMVGFVAVFLALNWRAYGGYFQDDEIDNLSWAPAVSSVEFLKGVVTPLYFQNNFRPVGHYYFHAVESVAGLEFPVYVGVLQGIHILNVWLLWLVARRLGARAGSAAAACCFFGLHMALFDNFWKPMYVFDVLCATFCLASILACLQGRWVWSFVAFWLAYKCKELAVVLPVALLGFEWFFGKRRWKPLIPFFVVAASFGIQGMVRNPNVDNDYTFRFTPAALAATVPFYAGRVFLIPWLGLALIALRRAWFGLAVAALFFFPLLFLPGRIFSAYCYLPFTGIAIGLSTIEAAPLALAIALWMPMNIHELRLRSRETLARDAEIRSWMNTVERFAESHPKIDTFYYEGAPRGFQQWGIEGALKYFYKRLDLTVRSNDSGARSGALIQWDWIAKRATVTVLPQPSDSR